MVKVKFFGLLRLDLKIKEIEVEALTVNEMLQKLSEQIPSMTVKDFKGYLIYVNGTPINKLKNFRTKLKDGDEVVMMNPASGG